MTSPAGTRTVLFAHPIADLYGSDRQLLESIRAVTAAGDRAVVAVPHDGPLAPHLVAVHAEVIVTRFPVLRRSILAPLVMVGFLYATARFLMSSRSLLTSIAPDVVYVNTLTIPVWLAAARLAGVPALCHVHEAEDDGSRLRRRVLAWPLRLARRIVVNSRASEQSLTDVLPSLGPRIHLVYNGIAQPTTSSDRPDRELTPSSSHAHVVCIGRLSPRKGTDLALEATAIVRRRGTGVDLTVVGTCFEGYEWFEADLRRRADETDLAGAVTFTGYVDDVYELLADADLALVPSRREPFGNTAVEAQMAGVPLIAARTQGLTEIVTDGVTGLLFTPDDASDLAAKITEVLGDPASASARAERARHSAATAFDVSAYAASICAHIEGIAPPTHAAVG